MHILENATKRATDRVILFLIHDEAQSRSATRERKAVQDVCDGHLCLFINLKAA